MYQSEYKKCTTAQELNTLTREERLTRCGYDNFNWNQSGVCISTQYGFRDNFNHTKQNTVRDKKALEEVFTKEEAVQLKESFVPSLQKTTLLETLQRQAEEEEFNG